jgi:hypothetical protein
MKNLRLPLQDSTLGFMRYLSHSSRLAAATISRVITHI